MQVNTPEIWRLRLITFLLAALAAASVGYWTLQWPTTASSTRAALLEPSARPIDTTRIARLLGANPEAANSGPASPVQITQSKYKLMGVIATGPNSGSALIATDDKPAKPYRVGEPLSEGLVLQSVHARSAQLGTQQQGATSLTLELPPLPGTN
ncbi:MAG: hypothetical protein FD135_874 [Comamonadaceae bacterium]|nr:MAG: hypothetical protein FD135_874 [Comamonadaceae bacterium]